MSSVAPTSPSGTTRVLSRALDERDVHVPSESHPASVPPLSASIPPSTQDDPSPDSTQRSEEHALESHEVIELQLFSEKKAWIEEKIKVISCFSGGAGLSTNPVIVPPKPASC
jgi:hypothetical protein